MNGTQTTHSHNNVSVFILMLILNIVQGIDYANILEHSIKAVITALVWLVFKIIADRIASNKEGKDKEGSDE